MTSRSVPIDAAHQVRWLFLDLNSYFASCEQQMNPRLRGKPIAVVPMKTDSTCVIAASYEAKRFGIKTGTLVGEARRMCPGLILIEGEHEHYIRFHHEIIEAVGKVLPVDSVLSVDEMAFKLLGTERKVERASQLAQELKRAIEQNVGECLTSSIGLAPNRYLAKVASDMQKPNGLTVITLADLPHKLLSLKLRDFPGIGAKMEHRLMRRGIISTPSLLQKSREELREIWGGVGGERFHDWLRGEETYEQETKRHSISHSHVLAPEFRNWEGSWKVLQKLVIKAAYRLRRDELWAKRVEVFARFAGEKREKKGWGGGDWSAGMGEFETQDTFTFLELAKTLFATCPRDQGMPVQVGVILGNLVADGFHTPSFFEDPRRLGVSRSVDRLNAKFGSGTVYFGSQHQARVEGEKSEKAAPLRIAFSRIPELDENF